MDNNNISGSNNQNTYINNDEIMNRVNQSFDKITQEVKNMINNNDQPDNNQFS